jgi:hypothetical protein
MAEEMTKKCLLGEKVRRRGGIQGHARLDSPRNCRSFRGM